MISDKKEINKLRNIRLLAMDIDGVLTDGGVYVFENGQELRRFNIKDGLGIKQVMQKGIQVVWISAGVCEAAHHRAQRLGIEEVYLGVADKASFLEQICREKDIPFGNVAYIGDDLTDLGVMQLVGMACAPMDAVEGIKKIAGYITQAKAGQGAVREICDLLLHPISDLG